MTNTLLARSATIAVAAFAAAISGSTALSSSASAQTAVYGGGATLPAIALRDALDCIGQPVEAPTVVTTPNPVNCVAAPTPKDNVTHLYAAVGSGNGRNPFINEGVITAVPGAGEPTFTTATFPAYPYPKLHYAVSETPLTQADLDRYCSTPSPAPLDSTYVGGTQLCSVIATESAAAKNGPVNQFPLAATSVTISVNENPAFTAGTERLNLVNSTNAPAGRLRLSRNEYCAIWGGYATTWDSPILNSLVNNRNGGVALTQPGSKIIRVVRSDSSGTTTLFAQRLREQCATTTYPYPFPTPIGGTVPFATFGNPVITGNGNGEVATKLSEVATDVDGDGVLDIRIGYVSPSFVEPANNNSVFAASLQTRFNSTVFAAPSVNNVRNGIRNVQPPVFTSSDTAPALNALNWSNLQGVNNGIVDSDIEYPSANGAYPIVGFTFGLFYTCYQDQNVRDALANGVQATSLATFLTLSPNGSRTGFNSENIFRNAGLLKPQAFTDDANPDNNMREAVRTLLLIDNRTRPRTGTRPFGANNFFGCSTGA